jgi:hypothetical protein
LNLFSALQITAIPPRSGTFLGSITFRTPDGQLAWYALEVRASEPDVVETIHVATKVGTAVAIRVPMKNPLQEAVQMTVAYLGAPGELLGPSTLSLPLSSQPTVLEFVFAPLRSGRSEAILLIDNEEVS